MKRDNPFRDRKENETYCEYYLNERSLSPERERSVRTAWDHLVEFCQEKGHTVEEIGPSEASDFCYYLKDLDRVAENTAEFYVQTLSYMIKWLTGRGMADYDPFGAVLEDEDPFEYSEQTHLVEIPLNKLREAIAKIENPTTLLLVALLLKTGLRRSEAINLDYRDIHLDHPISSIMPEPRVEIREKPDSLYVDSSISEDEKHNGEVRSQGNKPSSFRPIPIDQELKDLLVWTIGMNQSLSSKPHPLIRTPSSPHGDRISKQHTYHLFSEFAESNGWRSTHGLDVYPHWCRHWFSTTIEDNIDSNKVKTGTVKDYAGALRGDQDSKTIDRYLQRHWGEDNWKRTAYESGMPNLLRNYD